jgi:ATP-dependent Clp protease ATP-binding subunit ClpA
MTELSRTPRMQQILDAAEEIAHAHGHTYVGVEHLQLAILADRDAIPTQVLEQLGIKPTRAARAIADLMEGDGYRTPRARARGLDGVVVEQP